MVGRKTHRRSTHRRSTHRRSTHRTRKLKHKRSTKNKRSGHKRSTKSKTHKKYKRRIQRGGNYTAYPAQAYGPLLNGNGLNQIGPSYNVAAPGGNHYAYNMNVKALPIDSNAPFDKGQQGGKKQKNKNKKNKQRGGGVSSFISGILPDEIMNIGRSVPAAVGHFADRFNGVISTPSSMVYPTQQPLVPNVNATNVLNPVDIQRIYNNANASVLAV
jgi:hypothetical protein